MGKNKRPKNFYIQLAKKQKKYHSVLSPGLTGFLCTCNDRERDCVIEAYNILNEYADQMYGKEEIPGSRFTKEDDGSKSQEGIKSSEVAEKTEKKVSSEEKEDGYSEGSTQTKVCEEEKLSEAAQKDTEGQKDVDHKEPEKQDESKIKSNVQKRKGTEDSSDSDEELSVDAALKADVEELQKENEKKHRHLRRFSQVATGASNYIFIRTTLEDPLPLSLAIMDDILRLQQRKTKKLIRMIPVQTTCRAFQDDILKAVKNQCESYFKEKGGSFYIAIKVRNNNSVQQEPLKLSLITVLSEAHSENYPELKDPNVVVNIDVIKNICCISFLPGYLTKYCKYNLLTLGDKKENAKSIAKVEEKEADMPEKEEDAK